MRLKELRIKSGITQNELAKKLNVTGQTLLNWENGIYEPKIHQLIQLADFFGVTVDYLIERDSKNEVETICKRLESIPKENFINFVKNELDK